MKEARERGDWEKGTRVRKRKRKSKREREGERRRVTIGPRFRNANRDASRPALYANARLLCEGRGEREVRSLATRLFLRNARRNERRASERASIRSANIASVVADFVGVKREKRFFFFFFFQRRHDKSIIQ